MGVSNVGPFGNLAWACSRTAGQSTISASFYSCPHQCVGPEAWAAPALPVLGTPRHSTGVASCGSSSAKWKLSGLEDHQPALGSIGINRHSPSPLRASSRCKRSEHRNSQWLENCSCNLPRQCQAWLHRDTEKSSSTLR